MNTTEDLIGRLVDFLASVQPNEINPCIIYHMRAFVLIGDYESTTSYESPCRPKANRNSIIAHSPPNLFNRQAYWQQGEVPDLPAPFTGQINPRAPDLQRRVVEAPDALHSMKHEDTQNWWHIDNGDAPDLIPFLTPTIHPSSASVPRSQEPPSTATIADHGETLQSPSSSEGVPQKGCCRICGKDYAVTSSTDCPECTKRSGLPGKRKTFPCPKCPLSYTRASTLKEHLRTHSKEKPYECSHCSKAFTRMKDCNRHQRLHDDDLYTCALVDELANSTFVGHSCGHSFTRKDSLIAHFNTKIGARCAERYVAFFFKGLKYEEEMIGSAAVCTFHDSKGPGCGREFKDTDELREHLMAPLKLHCMKDSVLRYAGILQET
jgi:hypothetical protein